MSEEQAPEDTAADDIQQDEASLLESLQAKADEHWERYLRAVAEQDNIRKRAERDVEHAHRYALDRFVGDLAPVRESLEMGLQAEASDAAALREGVEMTLKQLDQVLSKHGVAVVDPDGERFDPELHEAIQAVPHPDAAPDTVLTVVQKGLTLNGRLLRPARVIVARAPDEGSSGQGA